MKHLPPPSPNNRHLLVAQAVRRTKNQEEGTWSFLESHKILMSYVICRGRKENGKNGMKQRRPRGHGMSSFASGRSLQKFQQKSCTWEADRRTI